MRHDQYGTGREAKCWHSRKYTSADQSKVSMTILHRKFNVTLMIFLVMGQFSDKKKVLRGPLWKVGSVDESAEKRAGAARAHSTSLRCDPQYDRGRGWGLIYVPHLKRKHHGLIPLYTRSCGLQGTAAGRVAKPWECQRLVQEELLLQTALTTDKANITPPNPTFKKKRKKKKISTGIVKYMFVKK